MGANFRPPWNPLDRRPAVDKRVNVCVRDREQNLGPWHIHQDDGLAYHGMTCKSAEVETRLKNFLGRS